MAQATNNMILTVLYGIMCGTTTNNNHSVPLMQLTPDIANHCASYLTPSNFVHFSASCSGINQALQPHYPQQMICVIQNVIQEMHAMQISIAEEHTQQSTDNALSVYMYATRECDMYSITADINLWLSNITTTHSLFKTSNWIPNGDHVLHHHLIQDIEKHIQTSHMIPKLNAIKHQLNVVRKQSFYEAYPAVREVLEILNHFKTDNSSYFNNLLKYHDVIWKRIDLTFLWVPTFFAYDVHLSEDDMIILRTIKQHFKDVWSNLWRAMCYRLYNLVSGRSTVLPLQDSRHVDSFFALLEFTDITLFDIEDPRRNGWRAVNAVRQKLRDDESLWSNLKILFQHAEQFLLSLARDRTLYVNYQSEFKQMANTEFSISNVLDRMDDVIYDLQLYLAPSPRNVFLLNIGFMIHDRIVYVRAVIEDLSNQVLHHRSLDNTIHMAWLLSYLTSTVDAIYSHQDFVQLTHLMNVTQLMSTTSRLYLMYNVLDVNWVAF
eukprot:223153_1